MAECRVNRRLEVSVLVSFNAGFRVTVESRFKFPHEDFLNSDVVWGCLPNRFGIIFELEDGITALNLQGSPHTYICLPDLGAFLYPNFYHSRTCARLCTSRTITRTFLAEKISSGHWNLISLFDRLAREQFGCVKINNGIPMLSKV